MAKFGHYAKAITFAKLSLWVKNYNPKMHAKSHSTTAKELLCAKKQLSKTHNIRKITSFPTWPNLATMQRYNLRKIFNLGQKSKFSNTCEKQLHNHIRAALCKETAFN